MPALAPDRPANQQFALSDMEEMAKKEGIDIHSNPEDPTTSTEPAQVEPAKEEVKPVEEKPAEETPAEGGTNEEAMQAAHDAEEKAKAEADEVAKAEAEKPKTEPVAPNPRDVDLDEKAAPHVSPKMRQVIDAKNTKIREARDRADTIAREHEELKAKYAEAEKKATSIEPPKELVEEVKALRERVRELDISADPEIQAKYDKRIASNNESIVSTLKSFGFGTMKGEGDKVVENPKAVADLMKSGLTFASLNPLLKKLDELGAVEEAEQIRESIRENVRLARGKQEEIQQWKGNYEQRQKAKENEGRAAQEGRNTAFRTQTDTHLRADLEALAKDFPFLKQPPAPTAADSPAVAKVKQAALDEYESASKKIQEAVAMFKTDGVAPEKLAEVVGKLNANAVQAIVFKTHMLPKLKADLAARDARIKQLEADIGKFKGASSLSREHATQASQAGGNAPVIPKDMPLADAMTTFAKQLGVNANS